MENGKQPVLTGVIQSGEKDPKKRKILGRIALWRVEKRKGRRTPSSNDFGGGWNVHDKRKREGNRRTLPNGKVVLKRCPLVM